MKLIIILGISFLLLFVSCTKAQTIEQIKKLETTNQKCLDSGINKLICSREYYLKMDSSLKAVYLSLYFSVNSRLQRYLDKEQRNWITKRDKYFKKQNDEVRRKEKHKTANEDSYIQVYQNDAGFIKSRVLELINRINNRPA